MRVIKQRGNISVIKTAVLFNSLRISFLLCIENKIFIHAKMLNKANTTMIEKVSIFVTKQKITRNKKVTAAKASFRYGNLFRPHLHNNRESSLDEVIEINTPSKIKIIRPNCPLMVTIRKKINSITMLLYSLFKNIRFPRISCFWNNSKKRYYRNCC